LIDRRAPGQPSRLNADHRSALAAIVEAGPDPAVHGVVRWRIIDLCRWVWNQFQIRVSKQTLSRELRAMGFRKLSARPRHHAQAAGAIEEFKNVWPAPFASSFVDLTAPVCVNVYGPPALPRPRWRSAHSGSS
jgi:hypothetical protein